MEQILNCVGCVSNSNDIVPINDKTKYPIALQLQRLVLWILALVVDNNDR